MSGEIRAPTQAERLRAARDKARQGSNMLLQAYLEQGVEAVRDALNNLQEHMPEDVYGGYAD